MDAAPCHSLSNTSSISTYPRWLLFSAGRHFSSFFQLVGFGPYSVPESKVHRNIIQDVAIIEPVWIILNLFSSFRNQRHSGFQEIYLLLLRSKFRYSIHNTPHPVSNLSHASPKQFLHFSYMRSALVFLSYIYRFSNRSLRFSFTD